MTNGSKSAPRNRDEGDAAHCPSDLRPVPAPPRLPVPRAPHSGEWLTFRSGAEEYAVDNASVRGIRAFGLPAQEAADAAIVGVAIVQGAVLPVADLRPRGASGSAGLTSTLVLDVGGRRIGVAVGAVGEVLRLRAHEILPAPPFPRGPGTAHVMGIATPESGGGRRTVVLIDVGKWLDARFPAPR